MLDEFVNKHLQLLDLEKDAEVEETRSLLDGVPLKELEKRGVSIRKLKIGEKRTGLYGRVLVKFIPHWTNLTLPSHKIGSGDIVGIVTTASPQNVLISGVVWAVRANSLTIAFDANSDDLPIEEQAVYHLIKLANDVTYRRLRGALLDLRRNGCPLVDILFGEKSPSEPLSSLPKCILNGNGEVSFFNASLDEFQRDAVRFALMQKEVAIIHGPPGTGKTTTVIEVILQAIAQGLKVLACAPSNVAVDNLVERLAKSRVRLTRLGHPARVLSEIKDLSLDALLSKCDNATLIDDIQADISKILAKCNKSKDKGERFRLRNEVKLLSKDLREREKAAIREVLTGSDVIAATLTSSYSDGPLKHVPDGHFDVVVIDECSQAIEASCWIPLLLGSKKLVIAGDHLQLPPTIVSEEAAKQGLEVTLMERLLKLESGKSLVRMLVTQYRMNEKIMIWPSRQLYEGKLIAHPSVRQILLKDLDGVKTNVDDDDDVTGTPLLLIDTAGCDLYERECEDEVSKGNDGEAVLVAIHIDNLVKCGVKPQNIAVITPYNLQVEIIRSLLSHKFSDLEIKSVDGFQGREKEAVVISLVRSNNNGNVGFLSEDRRLNVAITRARRHLAVICDSETVSHQPFLKEFIEYLNLQGEVRTAHQYQHQSLYSEHIGLLDKVKSATKSSGSKTATANRKKQKAAKVPTVPNQKISLTTANEVKQNNEARKDEHIKFQAIVQDFMADSAATSYAFPPTLTSYERMLVHELAEKFSLLHISVGEDDKRHIVIKKATVKSSKRDKRKPDNAERTELKTGVLVKKDPNSRDSSSGEEDILKIPPQCNKKDKKKAKSKCTSGQQPSRASKEAKNDEDNACLDEFIAKTLEEKTCNFNSCKDGLTVVKHVCPLCNNNFCVQHRLPEVHGCTNSATARKKYLRLTTGNVGSRPNPEARARLQKKLAKKVSELSDQRSNKKVSSKKQK